MATFKEMQTAAPFIINKNLGSALVVEDEPNFNAAGEAVVPPTAKQKYDFDRNGWILFPGVLADDDVEEMREFCLRLRREPDSVPKHERCGLGGPLQRLADHPIVVGFLNEFLAYAPAASPECYGFRFETANIFHRSARDGQTGSFGPHNGNGLFRLPGDSHLYRCIPGKAWSGLTRIVWELNPVEKGRGGTLLVTGSHKAAYPAPESMRQPESPLWDTYGCPPGSLLIFSEAVTHSACPWTNENNDRLAIFNLYNTIASRWTDWLPDTELLDSMPPLRQTLFRGVYAGDNVAGGFKSKTSPYADSKVGG
jgi:hypothetical protein